MTFSIGVDSEIKLKSQRRAQVVIWEINHGEVLSMYSVENKNNKQYIKEALIKS